MRHVYLYVSVGTIYIYRYAMCLFAVVLRQLINYVHVNAKLLYTHVSLFSPLSDFTPALQIITPVLFEYLSDMHADETQGGGVSGKLSLSRGGAGWSLPSGLSSKKTTSLLARDHKMDN